MKRIISLCCIALILVSSMAAPVQADEINTGWINVLDYATLNDSGTNMFYYTSAAASELFTYSLPDNYYLSYVDILFRTDSTSPQLSITGESLTIEYVGNDNYNLYRAYGRTWAYNTSFSLSYTHSDGTWVDFVRFNACSTDPNGKDIEAYCKIVAADVDQTIHYVPTDATNHRIFDAPDTYQDTFLISYIWTDDWKKYDYIDFQLMFDIFDITSVAGVMGSTNVPVEVSYINSTPVDGNSYYVTFRMDVSQLDRSVDDYPMIVVHGRLHPGVLNSIDFANCSGSVKSSSFSELALYFRNLHLWLLEQSNVLIGTWIYYFDQLNTWLVNQSNSIINTIGYYYGLLDAAVTAHFNNLDTWITNQSNVLINTISYYYGLLDAALTGHFNNLDKWIDDQSNVLIETFLYLFDKDTSPADQFQGQVTEKDQQMDDMVAVMDSVKKPDIDQFDVSVDQYVSQADLQVLASPMAVFFEADIFSSMIIMSILLATVSYVLYGKR